MSYIGKAPIDRTLGLSQKNVFTGDGSTVSFDMTTAAPDGGDTAVDVFVDNVRQEPGTGKAYVLAQDGSSEWKRITFSTAPASAATIWTNNRLRTQITNTLPSSGTVTNTMLNASVITGNAALGTTPSAADTFILYDDSASSFKKVTYSNLESDTADMAANTVKVRDAATTGAPSNKAVTDTQILIGDGTGFTAAALSGAITMTNAGVTSYATTPAVLTGTTNNTIPTVTGANAIAGEANLLYDGTSLDVKNGGTASDIKVYCESSNAHYVSIKSPAHADFTGGSWTFTLPGTNGLNGQALLTNGSGVASWGSAGETWAIKTAAYTAAAGDGVMVDTDSSAITITLPVSGTLGDVIRIMDATGNAATNNITVARNGNNIQGAATDLTIATNRAAIGLVYVNATEGWVLIEN